MFFLQLFDSPTSEPLRLLRSGHRLGHRLGHRTKNRRRTDLVAPWYPPTIPPAVPHALRTPVWLLIGAWCRSHGLHLSKTLFRYIGFLRIIIFIKCTMEKKLCRREAYVGVLPDGQQHLCIANRFNCLVSFRNFSSDNLHEALFRYVLVIIWYTFKYRTNFVHNFFFVCFCHSFSLIKTYQ